METKIDGHYKVGSNEREQVKEIAKAIINDVVHEMKEMCPAETWVAP